MKKTLILTSLGLVSMLSAQPYYQGQQGGNCPGGNCPNRQPYNQPYYQPQAQHSIQPYYEDWQTNQMDPYYPEQQTGGYTQNRPYNQGNQGNQGYYNQGYNNQGYNNQGSSYRQDQGMYGQDQNNYNQDRSSSNYNQNRSGSQKMVPDQEIAHSVHDIISAGWTSKGYPNVTFDVNNGVVNLRGSVDNKDDKAKVEESVRKIDGVRQVNNQITVAGERAAMAYYQPGYMADNENKMRDNEKKYPQDYAATDADRQINSKIRDKLSNGWFSNGYETVIIRTTNGVVTISGTVDNSDDIKKVNDTIRKVEGVKSVNNQLTSKNR